MKKYLALALAVFLLIAGSMLWLLHARQSAPSSATTSASGGTSFSGPNLTASSSTQGAVHVARGTSGGDLIVKDFLKASTTIADTQNPGTFYVAGVPGYCLVSGGCPPGAPADDFVITYDQAARSFTVILTQEPLGDARKHAESFLMAALGISQANLCSLSYYLGTVNAVNDEFAGKNLGFSFCPDAVKLP